MALYSLSEYVGSTGTPGRNVSRLTYPLRTFTARHLWRGRGIVPTFYRWLRLLRSRFILPPRTLPRCIILPLTRRSFDKIPIVREGYRTAHTEPLPRALSPIFIRPSEQMLGSLSILFFFFLFVLSFLMLVTLLYYRFQRGWIDRKERLGNGRSKSLQRMRKVPIRRCIV